MAYGKYFGLRVLNAILVLVVVMFIISALFNTVMEDRQRVTVRETVAAESRDPSIAQMSAKEREEWVKNRIEYYTELYGLDDPYLEKVITRTKNTLTLKLGVSHKLPAPSGSKKVTDIILGYLPRSILLFTTAAMIYSIIGIFLGLKAAQRAGSSLDKGISVFGLLTRSLPMWWIGMLFILLFAFELDWFPASSYPLPQYENFFQYAGGVLYKMILPLVTIVFVSFGGWAYTSRNLVIGILQEDYIMVARAKGVPERKVIYGHVLRAAAPSIVTLTIFTFLGTLGGAIITESVFNWPGMGRLYWAALQMDEIEVIMGLTLVTVFLYLAGMVLADLIYGYLDPRVKVGASQNV
ncbi:MAG: ABC transporter permease [Euryarchaeota archaeon]|nr:ABC transporter permease [Euryarchaeota archaeon]